MFGVSTREVYGLPARRRTEGDLHSHPERRGRKLNLTQEHLDKVEAAVRGKFDITILDLIHDRDLHISESRLNRIVGKCGFPYKIIYAS